LGQCGSGSRCFVCDVGWASDLRWCRQILFPWGHDEGRRGRHMLAAILPVGTATETWPCHCRVDSLFGARFPLVYAGNRSCRAFYSSADLLLCPPDPARAWPSKFRYKKRSPPHPVEIGFAAGIAPSAGFIKGRPFGAGWSRGLGIPGRPVCRAVPWGWMSPFCHALRPDGLASAIACFGAGPG